MERLVLRARYRTPLHDSYNEGFKQTTVTELRRSRGNVFRGAFRLPDSVVFAAFVVETSDAEWVDTNAGQPWELLVHGRDGKPLFDALEQRFNDYMGRDMREVLESARIATELYPDRPDAWNLLHAAEGWSAGAVESEALLARQRAKAEEVTERAGRRADLTAHEIAALAWLTYGSPAAEQWQARLSREHSAHPAAVMERMRVLRRDHEHEPGKLLQAYEELWSVVENAGPLATAQRAADVRRALASAGLTLALEHGPAEERDRWVARYVAAQEPAAIAGRFMGEPQLRDEGIRYAHQEIERLREHRTEDRPLRQTLSTQRSEHKRRIGHLLGSIGRTLIAAERLEEGVVQLQAAVGFAPSVENLRSLGHALFAAGDTLKAVRIWARVVAHPATSVALADSVRERAGEHFDPLMWEEAVSEGRAALLQETLGRATSRPIADFGLIGPDGTQHTLSSLSSNADAAVVIFVSRFCGFSMAAMPQIQALAETLHAENVVVLPITQDAPTDEYRAAYQEIEVDMPVYHDPDGIAAHLFNNWGTPQYFVLDGAGRVRFEQSNLAALSLQLLALREESRSSR